MRKRHKQGGNYEIDLGSDGVVVCSVHRRKELTRDQGARCAQEQAVHLTALAARPAHEARALLYDLTDAPDVWGPATQRALESMLKPWEAAHKRVIIVVGPEPIQRFNVETLLKACAPALGRIVGSLGEAESLLQRGR